MSSENPTQPEGQEYDLDSIELDEAEADYETEETNAKEQK